MKNQQAKATADNAVLDNQPIVLTGARPIVVIGHKLVSTKLVALMQHMLGEMDDLVENQGNVIAHDIHVVSFDATSMPIDEDSGKPAFSMWFPDTHTVCLYLRNIMADAERTLRTKRNNCSANMLLWQAKLHCLLHEIRHSQAMLVGEGEFTRAEMEQDADDWAMAMLPLMARTIDIQPPTLAEMPWLGAQVMGVMVQATKTDPKATWLYRQRTMNDKKFLYMSAKGAKTLKYLHDYFRARDLANGGDKEAWESAMIVPELKAQAMCDLQNVNPSEGECPAPPPPEEPAQAPAPPAAAPPPPPAGGPAPPPPSGPAAPAPPPPHPSAPMGNDWDEDGVFQPFDEGGDEEVYADDEGDDLPWYDGDEPGADGSASPASTGRTYQQKPNPTVQANDIPIADIISMMTNVYVGCWHHIFTKCGQLTGQDQAFSNPGAVLERISFAHVPRMGELLTHMDCSVAGAGGVAKYASQVAVSDCIIWGHVAAKNQMPHYSLYFNVHGTVIRRLLMPANPAKDNKSGRGARNGEQHLLVIDGDAGGGAKGMVTNGVYRAFD